MIFADRVLALIYHAPARTTVELERYKLNESLDVPSIGLRVFF